MIYPWHLSTWQIIQRAKQAGRLPHALLLSGEQGCGHEAFMATLEHSLLCSTPTAEGFACGHCRSCEVYQADAHPDSLWIKPAEDKTTISIDSVRELGRFLTLSISYSPVRVALISPAEGLNVNAANSLLKALEEPTPNTHLLLLSYQPGSLLPTIRSRCQHLRLPLPSTEMALAWLETQTLTHEPSALLSQALGRPLYAVTLDQGEQVTQQQVFMTQLAQVLNGQGSLPTFANSWQKYSRHEILDWLYVILQQHLKAHYGAGEPLNHPLSVWLSSCSSKQLWQLMQHWQALKPLADHPINQHIFIENMVAQWQLVKL
ncbi:DNA polymerase III subunit delta' [Thiofilum flexile]|uniref:DNA polymerase III subunit delta' n=1 Tax=Thiofilum flexile TaxID=125627 RepID=UPI00037B41EE|nr:DNA polymerase III subunit delta' [Thiofilum flexile]